jgi:hypothetical protein
VTALEVVADERDPTAEAIETRDRLLRKLRVQRRLGMAMLAWYEGRQDPPAVISRYRDAYRLLLDMSTTPWARLVVDTIVERLEVQGYQAGTPDQEQADAAWTLLQASEIDADQRLVYLDALLTGVGYVSLNPAAGEGELPRIAVESSMEVVHEPALGNRRRTAAALKLFPADWTGDDWLAELYTPTETRRWYADLGDRSLDEGESPVDGDKGIDELRWEDDDGAPAGNDYGVVPVVPFENRQTVLGGGTSELADLVPILMRIDKLTLDSLLTSEFSSFRQRWATGLEVPRDPESGKPVEPFKSAVDRLWISESDKTTFGSFEQTDIAGYLKAIEAQIAALAAISRVPSHYLLQQNLANPPSAESLVASESGLVAKVRERQRSFGEAWELAVRIGFRMQDRTEWADDVKSQVIWRDAELRNPAQVADAAVKLQTIGVPQEALWAYIGATPQEIEAWKVQAATAALLAPPPPPPTPGG